MADASEAVADRTAGRRWIVAVDAAAAASDLVTRLTADGAAGILVVAATPGTGTPPEATVHLVSVPPTATNMAGIRAFQTAIADPDDATRAVVDAFDPDRQARVIAAPYATGDTALGRPIDGARAPAWEALEDKTLVDALWDAAGVERAPAATVPVADAPAVAAALSGPFGTVWAADNSTGWHGGGDFARWVPPEADPAATVAWFAEHARVVRVMPFLDGLPCSIHGFTTGAGTAVLRPFEMVVLRRTDRTGFVYGGGATFWDPPDVDRTEMRATARRVGAMLDERVGYRGPFSVDGVMTAEGFRPTELNPRLSMGFGMQASTVGGLPMGSLTRALVEGAVDVDPGWLEEELVSAADARRAGGMGLPVPGPTREGEPIGVGFGPSGAESVAGPAEATMVVGPSTSGSFVRMTLDPDAVAGGPSVGSRAAAAARLAARHWDLPVPDLEPAPDLRR